MRHPPTDLIVVGGFLGAGKTTLLNRLLTGPDGAGLGVVVNDFGAINIDEQLVTARHGQVVSLANGCVCCDMGENLTDALFRLRELEAPPRTVVIEASGVADPGRIAAVAQVSRLFRLHAVVVLADAALVQAHAADRYLADTVLRQLRAADLLVVNKADLVGPEEMEALAGWLDGVTRAPRVVTTEADLPLDLLLGATAPASRAGTGDGGHAHFHSWSFAVDRPFNRAALGRVLDGLPVSVVRGKGLVVLSDAPEQRTVFHLVGRRWRFEGGGVPGAGSQLVLIGTGALPANLDETFRSALDGD